MSREVELLEQIANQLQELNQFLTAPQASNGMKLIVNRAEIMHELAPRVALARYYPNNKLGDCRGNLQNLVMVVRSGLDQAVDVQVIGSLGENVTDESAYFIEAPVALAAGAFIGLGVNLTMNWYPWMWLAIVTGGAAPTTGYVSAWLLVKEWVQL